MKMLLKICTHALQANYNPCQFPPESKDTSFVLKYILFVHHRVWLSLSLYVSNF